MKSKTFDIEDFKHLRKIRIATKKGEGKDKTITIYYRPTQGHGLLPFLHKFSRTAATVFSKTMENQLGESGTYAVIEGTNLKAYKQIFDWINMCVNVGNDEKFPEVFVTTLLLNS